MAFNMQSRHHQMPATFPDAARDKFDHTNEVIEAPPPYLANEKQERPVADTSRFPRSHSTDFSNHQRRASYNVPTSGGHRQELGQRDGRTNRPGANSHGGGNFNSQGGARFHPYSRHQQPVPLNAFGNYGDTYPTPPIAWHSGSDVPSQNLYPDPRPSAFSNYGVAYPTTPSAGHNGFDVPGGRPHRDSGEPQTLPPSWNQGQFSGPAMQIPQPSQQRPQYGTSGWHRDPAESAIARQFAAIWNTPSPYVANAPYVDPYSQPQINARPTGQRLQAQPSHKGKRHPAVPAVDEEVEGGEGSSEKEEDGEAGEEQELPTTKGTKASEKASKPKKEVRRGLTHIKADGELEWLATVDSEGVLAVRHDDIRSQLIAIAEAERVALGVENEHPDEPGPGEYNVTSFYLKHVAWGPDRENRPEVIFDWEEDKENNPRPKCPGHMYWEEDGKKYVVLDPHDNPVKDWDIPSTIASNIPGYKLEAMRRENMSLGHKDFWARMQSQINVGTEDQPIWEELGQPNSIVNMPMERFRFHAGLCSWTERKKTLIIKAGLKKLYGNKLQNNTIRAFGRDLTTKEIDEIKKGDNAVFPIKDDFVPATRKAAKKDRSKGAAKPTKPKGNAKVEKAQPQKRKRATEDGGQSSEEEAPTQVRSHKRARDGRKEDSIAAEVDDLVMFEQTPMIIDQVDVNGRYPLRSTRKEAQTSRKIESFEELSSESSADEEYGDIPTQRYSLRKTRKVAEARENSNKFEQASYESSAEEEDEYVPAQPSYPLRWIQIDEEPHRERDGVGAASRDSSVETDDAETPASRFPFRRIPQAGEVGGKSKGPSWVSSTGAKGQSNDETDYRHTAVPVSIGGSVHYATYEGLISNGPAHGVGGSGTLSQGQASKAIGAFLAQNESYPPQPHAFDVMMNRPLFEQRSLEEEDTPLQAHRKRVREFLGDEEAEAYAPPLKRLRTEQPVLPLPGSATHGGTSNVPSQLIPRPTVPSQVNPPQVYESSRAPPIPHAQPSLTRKQKLEAEWAQVFEQTFVDLGYQSVNYSEVPPWNEEEVQSLIDALLPTREVYLAWTGEPAPRTDPHQSYRAQFDTIFGAFQGWWREHRLNEPLPTITGVMHFGRSVDDWEPPSKDSIYYEAFRKGHRAPRGGDGKIIDLSGTPGSGLEDAYRKRS